MEWQIAKLIENDRNKQSFFQGVTLSPQLLSLHLVHQIDRIEQTLPLPGMDGRNTERSRQLLNLSLW
jgi:hypothetical protein